MTREEIAAKVKGIIVSHLGVSVESVTAGTSLDDLGADDTDLQELSMFMEDDFNITLRESDFQRDNLLVGDITDMVERASGRSVQV